MKPMTATMLSTSECRTVWRVDNPSTPFRQGGTYRVVTYPNSELVSLFTWVKNRSVARGVATKLLPRATEAIKAAQSAISKAKGV